MNVQVGDIVSFYPVGQTLPSPSTVQQVFTNLDSVDLKVILTGAQADSVAWFDAKPDPNPSYPFACPVLSL